MDIYMVRKMTKKTSSGDRWGHNDNNNNKLRLTFHPSSHSYTHTQRHHQIGVRLGWAETDAIRDNA